ncbi:hypothetical protein KP509_28G068900 [Ceratopteris richardii]|nr:hypothetical protein KP509_28G068900 [Ceratopteris richardii]
MYAKCDALTKAKEVFNELPQRNVIVWNTLIAGYVQWGFSDVAVSCYDQMLLERLCPDVVTFTSILKACAGIGAHEKGYAVHDSVAKFGLLDSDVYLCTALVDFYAKCGSLKEAQLVFDKLPVQELVTWNALIAGYTWHGYAEVAIKCYKRMQSKCIHANTSTFVTLLKSCGMIGALDEGLDLHASILRYHLLQTEKVGSALIEMYIECGMLERAKEVFEELLHRSESVWNSLIGGCADKKHVGESFRLFARMQCEGHCPDAITYTCIIKGSCTTGGLVQGMETHARIVGNGFLESEPTIGTPLVHMYAKFGLMKFAQENFSRIRDPTIVSRTALIGGYVQLGHFEEALSSYTQMQLEGFYPNAVTFSCMLKACGSVKALAEGQKMHAQITRIGILQECSTEKALYIPACHDAEHIHVGSALKTLECTQNAHDCEAFPCLGQVKNEQNFEDFDILSCILKVCNSTEPRYNHRKVHSEALQRQILLEQDVIVATSLIDMYSKCGMLSDAQKSFDLLPVHDLVLWNALITGYAQQAQGAEALHYFESMQLEGFAPNLVTYSCILKVCGKLGAMYRGQEMHDEIVRQGFSKDEIIVSNTLIGMYCDCGMLHEAQDTFNRIGTYDLISYNSLLMGLAQSGESKVAFSLLERMLAEGYNPDTITCIYLLTVCSHSGLFDEAQVILKNMNFTYGVNLDFEHLTCIVDCLGRAGCLDKIVILVKEMPFHSSSLMWHCVLGACRNEGNVELGQWALWNALEHFESDVGAYVCMHNIFGVAAACN